MDWQLLLLPVILVALLIASVVVKSWLDIKPGHERKHDSIDEAMTVNRSRGGPGPG